MITFGRIPERHAPVGRRARQNGTIGGKSDARHGANVGAERSHVPHIEFGIRRDAPELYGVAVTGRREEKGAIGKGGALMNRAEEKGQMNARYGTMVNKVAGNLTYP